MHKVLKLEGTVEVFKENINLDVPLFNIHWMYTARPWWLAVWFNFRFRLDLD